MYPSYFLTIPLHWRLYLSLVLLCNVQNLSAQIQAPMTKGAVPLEEELKNSSSGKTYAAIVGVSNYMDPGIPDLRYAHRDANIFADFLQDPRGGGLGKDQLKVIVDSNATLAGIQSILNWLITSCQKDDKAIIYFSGHGDVETKSNREKGYLLAHDTPKNNYPLNGLDIDYLNDSIIGRLTRSQVKVVVILDACHSGALAGDNIGGKEATAMELMKRFSSEVKIMSCQPYESSLEHQRWGNGRGLFSYYLLKGLEGEANKDTIREVDLYELESYLQEKVHLASGKAQHPDIFGGKKQESLFPAAVINTTEKNPEVFEEVNKGIINSVLVHLATSEGRNNYQKFIESIENSYLFKPLDNCAFKWYESLYSDSAFYGVRGILNEKMIVALTDPVQQAIVSYLNTDPKELELRENADDKYGQLAEYLRKALEIIGPGDSRYRQTKAKQYYFDGLVLRMKGQQINSKKLLEKSRSKQDSALALEDKAAYIHNELGLLSLELQDYQKALAHLKKAIEWSPTWAIPYNNLASATREIYGNEDSLTTAVRLYQMAIHYKPDFSSAYMNLGNLYKELNQIDSAEFSYRRALELNTNYKDYHLYLGLLLTETDTSRFREAENLYRQSLKIDAGYPEAYFELANLYDLLQEPDSAELNYKQAIKFKTDYSAAYTNLGIHYYSRGNLIDAELNMKYAIRADSLNQSAYAGLIFLYQQQWKKISTLLKRSPLPRKVKTELVRNRGLELQEENENQQALQLFQTYFNLYPTSADAQYLFGLYYHMIGNKPKALEHFTLCFKKIKPSKSPYLMDMIRSEDKLGELLKTTRYKELYKKYFPE